MVIISTKKRIFPQIFLFFLFTVIGLYSPFNLESGYAQESGVTRMDSVLQNYNIEEL